MGGRLNLRFHVPAFVALLALVNVATAQMMNVREKAYWDLVKQYKGTDRRGAVTAIGGWSTRDLEAVARVIEGRAKDARKCADCEARRTFDALPLKTALMLHAEHDRTARIASLLEGGGLATCAVTPQSTQIQRLLDSVVVQTGGVDFATRFLTAHSLNQRSLLCFVGAREWAELGLKVGPGDAGLHVAQGLAGESIGSIGSAPASRTSYDTRGRPISAYEPVDRKEALRVALEAFGKAVSLNPLFPGVRLRLGRVQWRTGRSAEAKESLKQAVSESSGPLLYLAHLFYGQCLEDEGDVAGAVAEYTSALAIRGDSQVAAVALAHARTLSGELDLAREVLDRVLPFSGKRWSLDPFWSYLTGQQEVAEALLEQLREEAIK